MPNLMKAISNVGWWNSTEVALKVMVSEDHRDRAVQREVKVGPTLTHPHVVTVSYANHGTMFSRARLPETSEQEATCCAVNPL